MADPIRIQLPSDATSTAKPTNGQQQQEQPSQEQQQQQQSNQAPQRPEGVPEKFWKDGKVDTDALLKSYTELEKKNSAPQQKQGEQQQQEKSDADKSKENSSQQQEVKPEEAFKPFFDEFAQKGELSPESYEKLQKDYKLPKSTIDNYIAGVRAQQEAMTTKVFESVGGKDNYEAMAQWAGENLSPEEINAYNEATASGDAAKINLAVSGLYQKFTSSEGRPGSRIRGNGGNSNVTPFRSSQEVVAAMQDKRYANDPAYRKEVEDRLRVSDVF